MSQHSSCWLPRHQFFIKYCITEKETFKGEKKIEFTVSAQALMISAFYRVINWLCEGKKQVVLHQAVQIQLLLLFIYLFFFVPFPKHLDFSTCLRHCLYGKKNELAAWQSLYYCAFILPQQIPMLAAHMWQNGLEQGTTLSCWSLIPMMHFTLAKG